MSRTISARQIYQALIQLCQIIEEQKDYLSELDGAIGDGDHGVNMAKCFRQVKAELPQVKGEDVGAILLKVGMVVMNSVGGAMGALYGTFFLKAAQAAAGKESLALADFLALIRAGEEGVLAIGKARVGDKTLVDTLHPAVEALGQAHDQGLGMSRALAEMVAAARSGMESTKEIQARLGRASRLGERTLGHQDAGATSCFFILQALAKAGQE